MPVVSNKPKGLRPYLFHGVDLSWRDGADEGIGDCPFCGREGKWSASTETGLWQCKVCGEGGNPITFLQKLWAESETPAEDLEELAREKGILKAESLSTWGVRRSCLTGEYIVPGYGPSGKIVQLYRYVNLYSKGKWVMLPTPKVIDEQEHGLLGMNLFDKKKSKVHVCEGLFDGVIWWEVMGRRVNVVAVPGCNVFLPGWVSLFKDKETVLLYDNDHPVKHPKTGKVSDPAAWRAMKEISQFLVQHGKQKEQIRILKWAPDDDGTHDPNMVHGWDIRDELKNLDTLTLRARAVDKVLKRLVQPPDKWFENVIQGGSGQRPTYCDSWVDLINHWQKPGAFRWRQELDDVLSVMLAVAASTEQLEDQLFLQVIGDAGSGKTSLCDGMLTSPMCRQLEHLTGFYSGFKDSEGNDYSLISRINLKTLITPEADIMVSLPNFKELMSQQRRIFDGQISANYKNRKEDMQWTGLRTPWIMVGTPKMLLNMDQSQLGDRFLRIYIDPPSRYERREIVKSAGESQLSALGVVLPNSGRSTNDGLSISRNGKPSSVGIISSNSEHIRPSDSNKVLAARMTGGYVNWLRENVSARLKQLQVDVPSLLHECAIMAEFVADMRARPEPEHRGGKDTETLPSKELPTRLVQQLLRLACCLAVVIQSPSVNEEVIRRVRKVAIDTSRGKTLEVIKLIKERGDKGANIQWMSVVSGDPESRIRTVLRFLRKIDVVKVVSKDKDGKPISPRWFLTPRFNELAKTVLGE